MTPSLLDIDQYLRSLVGSSVRTVGRNRENHVLSIDADSVIVGTERSPEGQPVALDDIRAAAARLLSEGELAINVDQLGHRSAFAGAVLASLPGVEAIAEPPSLRLKGAVTGSVVERERRRELWSLLEPEAPDHAAAPARTVRSIGMYNTGRGIFADLKRTRETTGDQRGATVSVRHTGRHYPDELSARGITYHYPETKNPSTDAMEVNATKAAGELGLPIFAILEGDRDQWRQVRPAWVAGWDDDKRMFHLQFGTLEAPRPVLALPSKDEHAGALEEFRPKDASDYRAHIAGGEIVKTRRHEQLVREFGEWAQQYGLRASTAEHPIDLVIRGDEREWIVEAKVLYRGNATDAVRAAIGQLLMYRQFLRPTGDCGMAALFAEPIGDAYAQFLDELHIAAIWQQAGEWAGNRCARAEGLTGRQ
ncbi:MAG: hypothetical protein RJQ01_09430 [Microcella sp.]|uniref:hypothetical protein n=1 Tax=Microcella sp. TaxID=1913979 RepID=UPI0032FFEC48